MATFNLLDEPWITCSVDAGSQTDVVSIRGALARAPELRAIADASPLAGVAMHRLLLALLHRVFGPATRDDWASLWRAGAWDMTRIDEYTARWQGRFDLWDEEYPFYQSRNLSATYATSIAVLAHELASGHNPTLFDHTHETGECAVTPARAAGYLLAHQAFALGGLVSFEKGQDRAVFGSATAAPLVNGAVCMLKGDTLFATLMLNLHRYSHVAEQPFAMDPDDKPAWERVDETRAESRYPRGYLDLLTWQSRRVRLLPESDDQGVTVVRSVVRMKGNQFADGFEVNQAEPMQAFRKNVHAKPGQTAWFPVSFGEDRALWRDSLALILSVAEENGRPRILDWVQQLVDGGVLDLQHTFPLAVAGLAADRAKALFWRQEHLPLPLAYLRNEELLGYLRRALMVAEAVGKLFLPGFTKQDVAGNQRTLPRPFQVFGQALATQSEERQPDEQDVRNIVSHLAPSRIYWSRLGQAFPTLLIDLAAELPDAERAAEREEEETEPSAVTAWVHEVRRAAWSAFRDSTHSLASSARALKAVACAERAFGAQLAHLLTPYGGAGPPEPADADADVTFLKGETMDGGQESPQ